MSRCVGGCGWWDSDWARSGPALSIFLGRVGAASSVCSEWLAIANVACKSEVALRHNKMSFVNICTTNMCLSDSDRLRW
jgi:hypothetical protein